MLVKVNLGFSRYTLENGIKSFPHILVSTSVLLTEKKMRESFLRFPPGGSRTPGETLP